MSQGHPQLIINTNSWQLIRVTKEPAPRLKPDGTEHEPPRWSTQLMVHDGEGAHILFVNTEYEPDVEFDDDVLLSGVEAHPWTTNNRSGVAFRAQRIEQVEE